MNTKFKKYIPQFVKRPLRYVQKAYRSSLTSVKRYETPRFLIYFVTKKCQLTCKHCFYASELNTPEDDGLTLKEIKKVVSSLRDPLDNLVIVGGEPSLNKDLADIVLLYRNLNRTKSILIDSNGFTTNSIIKTLDRIFSSAKGGINLSLQISLDGPERIHNEIREHPNSFRYAVETLRHAKEIKGLKVYVACTVNQANYKYLKELSEYCINDLRTPVVFELVRSSILDFQSPDYKPKEVATCAVPPNLGDVFNQIREIYQRQDKALKTAYYPSQIGVIKDEFIIGQDKRELYKCVAGNYSAVLFSNGDVSACELMTEKLNVRNFDYDLAKLWNAAEMRKLFQQIRTNCFCTLNCMLDVSRSRPDYALKRLFQRPFEWKADEHAGPNGDQVGRREELVQIIQPGERRARSEERRARGEERGAKGGEF